MNRGSVMTVARCSIPCKSVPDDRPTWPNLYPLTQADRLFASHQLLEPRVVPQRGEFRLDAGAGDVEPPPHAHGAPQAAQRLLGLAAPGVDARHVEARVRIVVAQAEPLLEHGKGDLEGRARLFVLAQVQMRGADALVELDRRLGAQGMVSLLDEPALSLELLHDFPQAALERGQVAEAHVRPHDDDPVAARLHLLLQGGGLTGGRLAAGEVAPEGRAV